MKVRLTVFILSLFFVIAADQASAQCPAFYHPRFTLVIDDVNFHRPKYDCERGFFICIETHWEIKCVPNSYLVAKPKLEDGKVHGYVLLKDEQVEIHLPAALADLDRYKDEEMNVFSVEPGIVTITLPDGSTRSLKEGDYLVERVEDELVITVDLE